MKGPQVCDPKISTVGLVGFENAPSMLTNLFPSIELHFGDWWIGFHCYQESSNRNRLDKEMAREIVEFVQSKLKNEGLDL